MKLKIISWVNKTPYSIFYRISISLYNTEVEILKANPFDLDEKIRETIDVT